MPQFTQLEVCLTVVSFLRSSRSLSSSKISQLCAMCLQKIIRNNLTLVFTLHTT